MQNPREVHIYFIEDLHPTESIWHAVMHAPELPLLAHMWRMAPPCSSVQTSCRYMYAVIAGVSSRWRVMAAPVIMRKARPIVVLTNIVLVQLVFCAWPAAAVARWRT